MSEPLKISAHMAARVANLAKAARELDQEYEDISESRNAQRVYEAAGRSLCRDIALLEYDLTKANQRINMMLSSRTPVDSVPPTPVDTSPEAPSHTLREFTLERTSHVQVLPLGPDDHVLGLGDSHMSLVVLLATKRENWSTLFRCARKDEAVNPDEWHYVGACSSYYIFREKAQ